jgi:hypothetical protein
MGRTEREIQESTTIFEISTHPSKTLGCWRRGKNEIPPKITLYPKNIMDVWGEDEASFIVGLCVYGLTEMLCMTRAEEHPKTRRYCGTGCPPERLSLNMILHTLDGK